MIHRLLYRLTASRPTRLITVNDAPYLERYYCGTLLGCTFYLHRFLSADGERHLHNHPFSAVSIVLTGSYREEVVHDLSGNGPITWTQLVRWFNRVPSNKFHRIAWARPGTWTLFIRGPRKVKGWGFLEDATFRTQPHSSDQWHSFAPLGRHSKREPLV